MPGPIANPRIILLDAAAATSAGPAIGLQGDTIQFAGTRQMPIPLEIVCKLNSGTSATVLIETDNDIAFGTATTWTTLTLTAAAPLRRVVGRLLKTYVRARPSAHTGGTIDCYMRVGV
jgi:hypothetical protein